MRTKDEINQEYTEVCKQLGDLVAKENSFKEAKDKLFIRVKELQAELGQSLLPDGPSKKEIEDKLKQVESKI